MIKTVLSDKKIINILKVLTAIIIVLSAFCFAHADSWFCITHWGLDFISIAKQGNALHFYQIDYVEGGMYSLFIIVLSAIWILPFHIVMKIIGIAPGIDVYNSWYKVLLILAVALSVYYLVKIFRMLGFSEEKTYLGVFMYSLCPVVAIGNVAMGQIDVLAATIVIIALYEFLRGKRLWMLVLFSIAIAFKFFAILIFVPLILMTEKRIWKIFVELMCALVPAVVTELVSSIDPYYVIGKIDYSGRLFATEFNMISAYVLFNIICFALCYFISPDKKDVRFYLMLAMPYLTFLLFVEWNPQWVVYIMPLVVIITLFSADTFFATVLHVGLGLGYLIHLICVYPRVLDNYMINRSTLHLITGKEYTGAPFQEVIGLYYSNVGKAVLVACIILIMLTAAADNLTSIRSKIPAGRKATRYDSYLLLIPSGLFIAMSLIMYIVS